MAKTLLVAAVAVSLTLVSTTAGAQTEFVSINGGGQIGSNEFTHEVVAPFRNEIVTGRADYPVESGPLFDVGGGVLVTQTLGVGVAFTRSSQSADAALFADAPDSPRNARTCPSRKPDPSARRSTQVAA